MAMRIVSQNKELKMKIVSGIILLVVGLIACMIGIYHLMPILFGIIMLAGGVCFIVLANWLFAQY